MPKKNNNTFWNAWKLKTNRGRQWWEFELPAELKAIIQKESDWQKPEGKTYLEKLSKAFAFDKQTNPNTGDRVFRSQVIKVPDLVSEIQLPDNVESKAAREAYKAAHKGFRFYKSLQTEAGNWPGDYGGPMFLMPGLVFTSYLTETPFEAPVKTLMVQYFFNHQNKDGGWGLHIEGESTMFGTVLQYVSLRLLGIEKEKATMAKARKWIQQNGGATGIPPWGKFYLSVLGLYEWEGNDSLLPELWILPRWLPFHPGRYWPHSRMVFLPMSYAYGNRITAPISPLITAIREEIYTENYEEIKWEKSRKFCAVPDQYQPLTKTYRVFSSLANFYEKFYLRYFRKKALKFIASYIDAEDSHTRHINIGPVNQVINSMCVWHRHGKESAEFQKHVERWKDYLWVAEDGIKMNGYNGSQLWDTVFATQALLEGGLENEFPELTQKMYAFIDDSQIKTNHFEHKKYFRDRTIGAWPFSTREHGWTITDCTGEGVKSSLLLNETLPVQSLGEPAIDQTRLAPAIDLLLSLQNPQGGWASYENIRGQAWLEKLNPSHIFGNIMIEYNYVECSSAVMQGLKKFGQTFPNYRKHEIKQSIQKGLHFIKSIQREDGSWYGSWGVCFTYGTWFGIEGLVSGGENTFDKETVSEALKKACAFLISKQRDDGSWGESFQSCVKKEYIEHEQGQVINTAWALLGLMAARYPDRKAIERGIAYLIKKQQPNGDWEQEGISGVFNGNCMEVYTSYRNVFPLWALGRFAHYRG
ncbi:MAG: terpene cyclase/mutase family protein [Bacteroidales bacterium]|nr:terpene cyclase/mutase family protein [Bacteroidales bacterium]